jgi:hypothetical protein
MFGGVWESKHVEDNDGYPGRLIDRYGLRISSVDGSPVFVLRNDEPERCDTRRDTGSSKKMDGI